MTDVFIIDDEYLVRESIKKSLDWSSLGLQIIGEAKDGKQALESIQQLKPDIIIVDINIPFINGIELSKKVRAINPSTKIIIVTGYGEFEYAREAIEAGVLRYLLKPIDTRELVQVLIKAQKEIEEEKKEKYYIESLKKKNLETEREKFLKKLILESSKEEELKSSIEIFELEITPERISTAVIVIDDLKEKFKEEQEIELWKYAVSNIAGEIFKEAFKSIIFYGQDNQIVILFNNEMENRIEAGRQICEKIRSIVKQYLNFTLTIGIGSVRNGFSQIGLSYADAVCAVSERFLSGFDQVIVYNPEESYGKNVPYSNNYSKEDILKELRIGNYENIRDKVERVFFQLTKEKSTKEHSVFIAMNMATIVVEFLNENNFNPNDITGGNLLETLMQKETKEALKNYILGLYSEAINCVFEKRNLGIGRTVEKAKNFIERNLADNALSLEKVAENIVINSSYLSSIFKQEMGLSVTEYITACRLEKSKELLDKFEYSNIEQLAEAVGYNDHYYFSKCFKKHFGLTPKKYSENKSLK